MKKHRMYHKTLSIDPGAHHSGNLFEWMMITAGIMPVTCIALHVSQIIPLHISAVFIALPGVLFLILAALRYPETGMLIIKGWLSGLLAVTLYDLSRIPFMLAGWNDFVPHIGDWMLNRQDVSGWVGYLWRYAGNGGGMGITFLLLTKYTTDKKERFIYGIMYGLAIFFSLIITLVIVPHAESLMFRITPLTFSGSMIGHIIYGAVLGSVSWKFRETFMNT